MRASEILRSLADFIASAEQMSSKTNNQSTSPTVVQNATELVAVNVDNIDHTDSGGTFVPPLQAKIELLKKAVDVKSIYDKNDPAEELSGHGTDTHDDVARMKKLAGINAVVTDEAASDEPLDI